MSNGIPESGGPKITPPVPNKDGQVLRIKTIPQALQSLAKAERLEGEVVRQNADGTARILTERGNIDVQTREKTPLKNGQKVEITVQAGKPPRQATVKPLPQQQAQNTLQTQNTRTQPEARPVQQTPQQSPQQSLNVRTDPGVQNPNTGGRAAQNTQQTSQQNPQQVLADRATQQSATQQSTTPQQTTQSTQAQAPIQTSTQAQTLQKTLLQAAQKPAQAQLKQGQVVRLLPVPEYQVQNILKNNAQPAQTLTTKLPGQVLTPTQQGVSNTPLQPALPPLLSPAQSTNSASQITSPNLPIQLQDFPDLLKAPILQIVSLNIQNLQNTAQVTIPRGEANLILQLLNFKPGQAAPAQNQGINPGSGISQAQNIQTRLPESLFFQNLTPRQTIPANNIVIQNTQNNFQTIAAGKNLSTTPLKISPLDVRILQTSNTSVEILPVQQLTRTNAQSNIHPILQNAQSGSITAKIIGFTPQNLPVLTFTPPNQTLPQFFILQTPVSQIVPNASVQIIPLAGHPAPQISTASLQQPALPLQQFMQQFFQFGPWPVLDDIAQTLQQVSPQAGGQFSNILPNPASPTQLGPAALFFLAAARGADLASWLGDKNMDMLRQQNFRSNLLSRLKSENSNVNRAVTETIAQEWRAAPLPLYYQGEVQKIMLYYKQSHADKESDDPEKGSMQTRFLFDLSLTRMGDIQIDGLMKDKRLDLMIRSENPFSQPMQQKMRQAFAGVLQETEIYGELHFQGSLKHWVNVLEKEKTYGADV